MKNSSSTLHIPRCCSAFAGLVLLAMAGQAQSFELTGDLDQWISTPTDLNSLLRPGTQAIIEDQNSNYLDPGYGGQNYDAEAIYVEIIDGFLHIAVLTGTAPDLLHDPANNLYGPGDIAINFGFTDDATSFELGIVTTDRGGLSAGDIYKIGTNGWEYGLWNAPKDTKGASEAGTTYYFSHPTAVVEGTGATKVGETGSSFFYGAAKHGGNSNAQIGEYPNQNHYLIEASIDTALLTSLNLPWQDKSFLVHWTQRCNNDWIEVDPPVNVPEPTAVLLFSAGLVGLGIGRRRQKR